MDISPEACAARGATWLDDYFGAQDWANRINLDELNIVDGRKCVAGQLFADKEEKGYGFLYFSDNIMPGCKELAMRGFSSTQFLVPERPYGLQLKEFADLTDAWRGEVLERTAA